MMKPENNQVSARPSLPWIILCWVLTLLVIYGVTEFMGFVLLTAFSPFIHPRDGMDLGPVAAIGLWLALGIGALAGAGTYLWLRSIGIKRRPSKTP